MIVDCSELKIRMLVVEAHLDFDLLVVIIETA
jgi:hypothetical protein